MVIRSLAEKKQRQMMGKAYNAHRLANQMRRYFAPASTFPPPNSSGYGNRNTAGTASNSQNTTPTDNVILQFNGGTPALAVWTFKTPFNQPPTVTATAITAGASAAEITLLGRATAKSSGGGAGVIFQSSVAGDKRFFSAHAIANNN